MRPFIPKLPAPQEVAGIKFPVKWFDCSSLQDRREVAEFKLGVGPCGKTVSRLLYHLSDHYFCIYQEHTDGSTKDFAYQTRDLLGRVEVESVPCS